MAYFKLLSKQLPGGNEKNYEKPQRREPGTSEYKMAVLTIRSLRSFRTFMSLYFVIGLKSRKYTQTRLSRVTRKFKFQYFDLIYTTEHDDVECSRLQIRVNVLYVDSIGQFGV